MQKKIIYCLAAVSVLGLCGLAAMGTLAQTEEGTYSLIVQKIAERFNLNSADVQQVFDEVRETQHQEMKARFEQGPNCLEEELTQEQKDALAEKREEMRTKMESLKDLGPEERKAEMDKINEEMKSWMEENGIEFGFLGRGFMHSPKGFGQGFGLPNLPETEK